MGSKIKSAQELEERINSGRYNEKQLRAMRGTFLKDAGLHMCDTPKRNHYLSLISMIDKHLSKLITVKRKVVFTPAPKKDDTKLSEPLSDSHVAKKYLQLEQSAKIRGKEFNLSLVDVKNLLKRKTCYYTKKRFELEGDMSLTIDRLDSELGYVKGNVVACTHWANQMKNALFEDDRSELKGKAKDIMKIINFVL